MGLRKISTIPPKVWKAFKNDEGFIEECTKDLEWYTKNKSYVINKYFRNCVAIKGQKVVEYDKSLSRLLSKIDSKYGRDERRHIVIEYAEDLKLLLPYVK